LESVSIICFIISINTFLQIKKEGWLYFIHV
jgi:hypothetical protein